jgi:hypothetical protein
MKGLGEVVKKVKWGHLGHAVARCGEGEGEGEKELEGVWERVGVGLQLGLVVDPGGHAEGQPQGRQVELEAAPEALLYLPAGHAVALTDERGQKLPGGHSTGAPEAQ